METKMTFGNFLNTYCKNTLNAIANHKSRYTSRDEYLSYDDILYDENNEPVKVIYTPAGLELKIEDIWTYTYEDFVHIYGEESLETYRLYRSAYKIKTGFELYLERIQQIEEAKRAYDNIPGTYEFDHLSI